MNMPNFIPHYIFWSKAFHHLALKTYGVWQIPFVRNRIGKNLPMIDKASLQKKLFGLLGIINKEVFRDSIENDTILQSAENAHGHKFDVLGSGPVKLEPMMWNKDLKTGFKWKSGVYCGKQRGQKGSKGSDVKIPWELSRCHHLLWLGEAYLITGKEDYAKSVVADIEDWMDQNPYFYSINWTCSMEVAIRAVNWMYAVLMVVNSDAVTDAFVSKLYKSLYQHGYFIYTHLEKSFPYSNNHYVSDLVGLLYLGMFFKKETDGKWYDFALSEYCIEIRQQILPSGVHYEKSVSYHRLMTELNGYAYYLLKRNREVIPDDIAYRVKTMFDYVAAYTKSNGLAPLIEDNDNGRLLPFVERDFRSHDYLIEDSLEMRIITGAIPRFTTDKAIRTRMYEDAGIAILKNEKAFLFVTCSGRDKYSEYNKRKRVGCHMHNDLMSFELAVGNQDVFVDGGSYLYTSDVAKHNEFRSARKHNTVMIDDEEQNFLMTDNAFEVERNSTVLRFKVRNEGEIQVCEGLYALHKSGATHERTFILSDNKLLIKDIITKEGEGHKAQLFFHCGDVINAQIKENAIEWEEGEYIFSMTSDAGTSTSIIDDTISPSYGVLILTKTIVVAVPFEAKKELITKIEWKKNSK